MKFLRARWQNGDENGVVGSIPLGITDLTNYVPIGAEILGIEEYDEVDQNLSKPPDWRGFGGALTLNPITRPWLEQVAIQSNFAYTQLAAIWATGDVNPPYSRDLWNICVAAVPVDGFAGLTHAIRSLAIQFEIPLAFHEDGVAVVID